MMNQARSALVAFMLLLTSVSSGILGAWMIATDANETGINGTDHVVNAKRLGTIFVNRNFESSDNNDPVSTFGWTAFHTLNPGSTVNPKVVEENMFTPGATNDLVTQKRLLISDNFTGITIPLNPVTAESRSMIMSFDAKIDAIWDIDNGVWTGGDQFNRIVNNHVSPTSPQNIAFMAAFRAGTTQIARVKCYLNGHEYFSRDPGEAEGVGFRAAALRQKYVENIPPIGAICYPLTYPLTQTSPDRSGIDIKWQMLDAQRLEFTGLNSGSVPVTSVFFHPDTLDGSTTQNVPADWEYAVYIERSIPADSALLSQAVKPYYFREGLGNVRQFLPVERELRLNLLWDAAAGTLKNSGEWYVRVVPWNKRVGLLPELGSQWMSVSYGGSGSDAYSVHSSRTLYPLYTPVDDGTFHDIDYYDLVMELSIKGSAVVSATRFSLYKMPFNIAILHDQESSTKYVTKLYINGGEILSLNIPTTELIDNVFLACDWNGYWIPRPSTPYKGVYIDNLYIASPNFPVIDTSNIRVNTKPGTMEGTDRVFNEIASTYVNVSAEIDDIISLKLFSNVFTLDNVYLTFNGVTIRMDGKRITIPSTDPAKLGTPRTRVEAHIDTSSISINDKRDMTIEVIPIFGRFPGASNTITKTVKLRTWRVDTTNPSGFILTNGVFSSPSNVGTLGFLLRVPASSVEAGTSINLVGESEGSGVSSTGASYFILHNGMQRSNPIAYTTTKTNRAVGGSTYTTWELRVENFDTRVPHDGFPAFSLQVNDYAMIIVKYKFELHVSTTLVGTFDIYAYNYYLVTAADVQQNIHVDSINGQTNVESLTISETSMQSLDDIEVIASITDMTGGLTIPPASCTMSLFRAGTAPNYLPGTFINSLPMTRTGTQYYGHIPASWIDSTYAGGEKKYNIRVETNSFPLSATKTVTIAFNKPDFEYKSPTAGGSYIAATMEYKFQLTGMSPGGGTDQLATDIDSVEITISNSGKPSFTGYHKILDPTLIGTASDKNFVSLGGDIYKLNLVNPLVNPNLETSGTPYTLTMKIKDKAGFTIEKSVSFTIASYAPNPVTTALLMDSGQLASNITNSLLKLTIDADTGQDAIHFTNIYYKVVKITGGTRTTIVDYESAPSGFPSNPIFTGSARHVTKVLGDNVWFDSDYFTTGEYEILLKFTTDISGSFEDQPVYVTGTDSSRFTVNQYDPRITLYTKNPWIYSAYTYVTEANVIFRGKITDPNGDLSTGTLYYDLTGVSSGGSNVAFTINSTDEFDISIPIGNFISDLPVVTIKARDTRMDIDEFATVSRQFRVDTSAPTITTGSLGTGYVDSGGMTYYTDTHGITVSSTIATTAGLEYAYYSIKDSSGNLVHDTMFTSTGLPGSEDFSEIIDISDLEAPIGVRVVYTIKWVAEDINNKLAFIEQSFIVDKRMASIVYLDTSPSITIVSSSQDIRFAATAPSGLTLDSIEYMIVDSAGVNVIALTPATSIGGNLYKASVSINLGAGSNYILNARATASNQYTTSSPKPIVTDKKPPVITVPSLSLSIDPAASTMIVQCNVIDPNTDLDTVTITISRELSTSFDEISMIYTGGTSWEKEIDIVGYGAWYVLVKAIDTTGLSSTKTITVIKEQPLLSASFFVTSPADGATVEESVYVRCDVAYGDIISKISYRVPDIGTSWIEMMRHDTTGNPDAPWFDVTIDTSSLSYESHDIEFRMSTYDTEDFLFKTISIYRIVPIAAPVLGDLSWNGTDVILSWNSVTYATEYRVYRAETSFTNIADAVLVATVTTNVFSDDTAETGRIYYYRVQGANIDGPGGISNLKSIDVPIPQPETWWETIIRLITGFFALIISFFTGLFGIFIVKARRRNAVADIDASMECLLDPKMDKCRIR